MCVEKNTINLDTERLYTEATQTVIEPFGKEYTWDLKVKLMGQVSIDSTRMIVEELGLPMTPDEYAQRFHDVVETIFPTSQLMPGS